MYNIQENSLIFVNTKFIFNQSATLIK